MIYTCTTFGSCCSHFFRGVFFHYYSRVTGACPVTMDLIVRVNVTTTTSLLGSMLIARQNDEFHLVKRPRSARSSACITMLSTCWHSSLQCRSRIHNTTPFGLRHVADTEVVTYFSTIFPSEAPNRLITRFMLCVGALQCSRHASCRARCRLVSTSQLPVAS